MKKSIIALLLVVSMVLSFSLTALASAGEAEQGPEDPKIEGNLIVDGFLATKSASIPLRDGGEYTLKFHAKSNGDLNWNNFILGITTGNEDVILIRADSYGWGSGTYFPTMDQIAAGDTIPFENNVTDWAAFVAAAQAGFDVEITLKREGDTLIYSAKMGDYTVAMTSAAKTALPETVYVFLSGEKCELTGITTEGTPSKAPVDPNGAVDVPELSGDLTVTNFFLEKTSMVPLKSGDIYTIKFHNKSNGTFVYQNFVLAVVGATGEAYTGAEQEIAIIRADNWGWGGGMSDFVAPNGTGNKMTFTSNITFDDGWISDCKAGFDVELTLKRDGDTLNYSAKMGEGGKYTAEMTATSGKALPETAYIFLTGESCELTGITTTKTTFTPTPVTPALPDDAVVIEEFNSRSAGTVTLKDGASAKFTFHNQSTGDLNWHNFVLFLRGTTADGTEDVGFIRADDFALSDATNYFGEVHGILNEGFTWDAWKADAQAGFDVEVTVSRSGKVINYVANMGKTGEGWKYTDTMTLTSASDLPDTITVSLTGEKCVLSNISCSLTAAELGSVGTEKVLLRDEGSYTFNFNAAPAETAEPDAKENFALFVTDGEGKTVLTIYADGTFTAGEGYTFKDAAPVAAMMALTGPESAGSDVKVEIGRNGNQLSYTITKGGADPITRTLTAEEELPETVNVQLTAANSTLSDIEVNGDAGKEPEKGEITYTDVPAPDLVINEFLGTKTDALTMKDGEGYHFSFYNQARGTENWHNFILGIVTDTDEVIYFRADNWVLGRGGYYTDGPCITNIGDWGAFVAEAQKGFLVDVKIGRSGDTLYYEAKMGDGGKYTVTLTATALKTLPETLNVFLSGEACALSSEPFETPFVPTPPTPSVPLIPFVPDDPVDGVKEVEKLEGNLNINNFFNRKTGAAALKSGESLTLTFKNRSNGLENWNNYVLAVVGATGTPYPGAEKEILIIRADSYGWSGGMADFGALNFTNNVEDWEAFKTDARAGMDVEILIERVDDTIHYLAKMGKYTFELTATSSVALPETAYVFLTGEKVSLTGIASVKGEAGDVEPVKPHTPETTEKIEGDLTVDGFLAAKSASIPLRDGGEYTFKFHAKSNGDLNWNNFLLGVTTGNEDVVLIRADSYGWGSGTYFPTMDQVAAGEAIPFENNVTDWAAFVAAAQAGFDVGITLKREGDTLTYSAKMGDYTVAMTSAAKKALPETVYVFLSGEKCELTGITTEGDPGKAPAEPVDPQPTDPEPTDPEPTDPEPTDPEPTEPEPTQPEPTTPEETYTPKIEGKLDVDVFFSAKTNMVPLRSGESYTFTFTNTSKGTANWDNFILAVVGATGKAYTGADQEILIVRADNYGWGGGMSDFARPGDPGNALAFESNINWDEWVAACKAGLPVTVTISRKGDTLTYEAKIGEWFVKLTAASGKALPATAYVFLTGENCTLSDIKTVSAPTYTSPKTGDTGTVGIWAAVLAVLATLAAAAVVVTKRYGRR